MKLSISMTRRETLLGWSYLLISLFVLPFALALLNGFLKNPLSATEINLVFTGLNFIIVAAIFHRFLIASIGIVKEKPWHCLRFALFGFALYYLASLVFSFAVGWLYPDFSNVNDGAVMDLFQEYPTLMALSTIFLVPITEETLYRGLLFQGLHHKSRLLAYAISTLVFASIHVMGYIGLYDFVTLCLCFIQYLPAGIALAWAYEKSDTILAPILMHITINQIGVSVMR